MRFVTGAACGLLTLAMGATATQAAPLSYAPAPVQSYVMPVADATIVWVQRYLLERGYYNGAVDGVSGPRTEAGVRAFEAAAGWPVTGNPYVLAGKLGYGVPAPTVVVPAPVPAPVIVGPGRPHYRHRP